MLIGYKTYIAAALNELIDKLKVLTDDLATAVSTVPKTEETQPQV